MIKDKLERMVSKIGLKLLGPYLLFSFFLFVLIFSFIYYGYNSEMNFTRDSQQKVAENVSDEIDFFISSTVSNLEFLSSSITCLDCHDAIELLTNSLFDINSDIYSIHIFDEQRGVASNLYRYGESGYSDNFELEILEDGELLKDFSEGVFISPVYISTYDLPFVFIGVPIFDELNMQTGTIVAELDLSSLWDVISRNKFKKTGYIYVIDINQEPKLIAYKDVNLLKSGYDISGFAGVNNVLNHNHSFSAYESFEGEKVFGTWSLLNSTSWGLLVEIPVKEVRGELFVFLLVSIIAIFLFVFFMVEVLLNIYKILLKPLKELSSGVDEIRAGNFKHIVRIETGDEIEGLAEAFNKMTHDLRVSHGRLRDYNINLEKKIKNRTLSLVNEKKKLKKINDKLTESEKKFRSYIDKAPDGIFVISKDGSFLESNNSALLLTGYSVEDLNKIKFVDIICEKESHRIEKHLDSVLKLGQVEDEFLYKKRGENSMGDDCERYLNVNSVKLSDDLVLVFIKDITREKEIDKAKTEFVSLASHQLRTPLSAINWYSEMLLAGDGGELTEDQRKFSEEISASNKRMVELVNALLSVSRLEMGTFVIEPELINLVEIMESVIKEQTPAIVNKKLKIKKKISPDIPIINSDPRLLRIVFQNLISNAVKYTDDKKSIYIEISLNDKKDGVHIKVQDEGYGIQRSQHDKVFTKLFRADNVKKRDTEGTGLGLYIVKAIVAHAGGDIWFESEEDKGTTFYLTLPLKGMKAKKGKKTLL